MNLLSHIMNTAIYNLSSLQESTIDDILFTEKFGLEMKLWASVLNNLPFSHKDSDILSHFILFVFMQLQILHSLYSNAIRYFQFDIDLLNSVLKIVRNNDCWKSNWSTGVLRIKRMRDSRRRAFGECLVVCTHLTLHSLLAQLTMWTIENLKFE